jgi:hypothetical protein
MAPQTQKRSQAKQARDDQKKLIDEYGRLKQQLTRFEAKYKRLVDLAKAIRSFAIGKDAAAPLSLEGNRYEVLLSACGMETHISSLAQVYEAMGHEKFLEAASMTLKSLEEHLGAGAVAMFTQKKQTGSRTLVARKKAQVAILSKAA